MKRQMISLLVTLLVSVFTFVPTHPVGACELDTYDRCIGMVATDATALYAAAIAPESLGSADSSATVSPQLCTNPTVGFPTCYVQQADGMWAREELADTNAGCVMVGIVTFNEVIAAIGDGNAIA